MYLVLGIRGSDQILLGTGKSAVEAVAVYDTAPEGFERIVVEDTGGDRTDIDELRNLAAAEVGP
jgi:hypothetical protein